MDANRARRGFLCAILAATLAGCATAAWQATAADGLAGETPPPAADTTPSHMVAFFAYSTVGCPQGWSPATYAQGRAIVAVSAAATLLKPVGAPMIANPEPEPIHSHTYATTVTVPERGIEAAPHDDHQGAHNGVYPVTGQTATETSNLPFIFLNVCEKD